MRMVLAVRKSDGWVAPFRQASARITPGFMLRNAAKHCGGEPDDYFEYEVRADQIKEALKAKAIRFNLQKREPRFDKYNHTEQKERDDVAAEEALRRQLMDAQRDLMAARELGLDTDEYEEQIAKLKPKHDKVKHARGKKSNVS